MSQDQYPDLSKFSKAVGISPERLMQAFEIEKKFHKKILEEKSYLERKRLYAEVYSTVHELYGKTVTNIAISSHKNKLVTLFAKELRGKSILDVGCGEGHFLATISRDIPHKELVGIDISIPELSKGHSDIQFITSDIIDFELKSKFDVVVSNQVLEHIAPADLSRHLASVKSLLNTNGLFIVTMPNRLFGPGDVTRIIDSSYTGKTKAQGTHLNESTYTEIIPILESHGFSNFKTVCHIPVIKYLLADYRTSPSLLEYIENSPTLLELLRKIRVNGRCVAKFDITLICTST